MYLRGCLAVCVRQGNNTLVHFDSWDDSLALQNVHERSAICSRLEQRLLEEDLQSSRRYSLPLSQELSRAKKCSPQLLSSCMSSIV